MAVIDSIRAEFSHETANTRRLLERVPEEPFAWKPHEKSMSLARLASHVAEIPGWGENALLHEELVFDPGGFQPFVAAHRPELLGVFDRGVVATLAAMEGVGDEALLVNWRMKVGDRVLFEMPRAVVIRTWVLNHLVHHRGQLTVYLRLQEIPLPALYGPSADEGRM